MTAHVEGEPSDFDLDKAISALSAAPASQQRVLPALPILVIAIVFGIAAAAGAVVSSGVLSEAGANWRLQALLVAIVCTTWMAGMIFLIDRLFGPPGAARVGVLRSAQSAFAAGPFLLLPFFAAVDLVSQSRSGPAAYGSVIALLVVAVARWQRLGPILEWLLLSLFVWLALLVAPAFWPDPINRLMVDLVLGGLKAAGLLH